MAILDTAGRKALPDSAFALPGRKYPIHNESHARNALARVSEYGTAEEKAKVRAAVHKKYPSINSQNEESGETSYDSEGNGDEPTELFTSGKKKYKV